MMAEPRLFQKVFIAVNPISPYLRENHARGLIFRHISTKLSEMRGKPLSYHNNMKSPQFCTHFLPIFKVFKAVLLDGPHKIVPK